VTSRLVEGEEETQFWKEANVKRAAERTKKGNRFGANKRGRNKPNRRGGPKRKFNHDDDDDDDQSDDEKEQSVKKAKGTTSD